MCLCVSVKMAAGGLRLAALVQGNALQARADTAYSTEWDVQEQATLDGTLARYPADRHPPLERYVRAAAGLPKKCAGGYMFKIDAHLQAQAYHHSSPIFIVPLANTNKSCTWRRAVQKRAARKTQLLDK